MAGSEKGYQRLLDDGNRFGGSAPNNYGSVQAVQPTLGHDGPATFATVRQTQPHFQNVWHLEQVHDILSSTTFWQRLLENSPLDCFLKSPICCCCKPGMNIPMSVDVHHGERPENTFVRVNHVWPEPMCKCCDEDFISTFTLRKFMYKYGPACTCFCCGACSVAAYAATSTIILLAAPAGCVSLGLLALGNNHSLNQTFRDWCPMCFEGGKNDAFTFVVSDVSAIDTQRYTNQCFGPCQACCNVCFPPMDIRSVNIHLQKQAGGRKMVVTAWHHNPSAYVTTAPQYQSLVDGEDSAKTLQNILMYLRTEGAHFPTVKL